MLLKEVVNPTDLHDLGQVALPFTSHCPHYTTRCIQQLRMAVGLNEMLEIDAWNLLDTF